MNRTQVIVGLGSCGIAAGAGKVYQTLENMDANFTLAKTSCIGMCYKEPLIEVIDKSGRYLYGDVTSEMAEQIMKAHIEEQTPLKKYVVQSNAFETDEAYFLNDQVKIATVRCGVIDPEKIEEYEASNGYLAIQSIIEHNARPENVIQQILESGIRGRGGGGFPTGLKWKFALNNDSSEKYIICNADEGDPGAFMDRSILEGDPHSVIEGMIICAYATKATSGIIYCRAEYPLAIKRLNIALKQARAKGYLGKSILGKADFSFDIFLKEGAGAFVCGEETALIASIEGERGMPRKRPPFPAESGLWQQPSNINNVETFANVAWIIHNGPHKYAAYGTQKSKGTKVFALTGKINNGGLVEVPMGITINDVIFNLGGGIQENKKFKAVQMGGPSGGCIPAHLGHTTIDYDSVKETGAIMGSGGMVVMDETTCMVDMARFFLEFTVKESCGKCTFCRIGTKRMLEILTRITEGNGQADDIEKLEVLAEQIKGTSLCGLGQTAPNPVLSTIRYFRDEYEEHINHKKCPALNCKPLLSYTIEQDKCTGCTLCARKCPTHAISGEIKMSHSINQSECIKCGACYSKCKFNAIQLS